MSSLFPLERNINIGYRSSKYIFGTAAHPNTNLVATTVALLCLILSVQLACHFTSSHFLGGAETSAARSHTRTHVYCSRNRAVLVKLSSLRLKAPVGGEEV